MDALPEFNIYDIGILTLLAIGILRGLARGLSGEMASLISIGIAVTAVWFLYEPAGDYIADSTGWSELKSHTIGVLIVLFAALLVLRIIGIGLKKIMSFTFNGVVEYLGGALFGLVRFGVIISAVIFLVYMHGRDRIKEEVTEQSLIGRHAVEFMRPMYDQLAERYPELQRIAPDHYPEFEDGADEEPEPSQGAGR